MVFLHRETWGGRTVKLDKVRYGTNFNSVFQSAQSNKINHNPRFKKG